MCEPYLLPVTQAFSFSRLKVKVKCTLVQAPRLCTGRTPHRGSRGIVLPFHDHGTRRGWGVSVRSRSLFNPEKDPVPIVQEAGWDPGSVWTGAENLASRGIPSPDRPARTQSLIPFTLPDPFSRLTVIQFQSYTCVVMNCKKNELMESLIFSYSFHG